MAGKYRLCTLGCKVNQYESQQIRELLESLGLHPARPQEKPLVAVVNTCAVTSSAARKSRQAIRRMTHNDTAIFVVGCGVSADAERLREIDGVVAVVKHDADICAVLRRLLASHLQRGLTRDVAGAASRGCKPPQRPGANGDDVWMSPRASDPGNRVLAQRTGKPSTDKILSRPLPIVKAAAALTGRIEHFAGHQRAFLKVQDGCDAGCTYCIVPRLRPRLAWKPIEVAVSEARGLVRAGHREIVVTGVFLGAYGRDTAVRKQFAPTRSPLAKLVDALATVPGLERLRLSSLEPGDVNEALLESLASYECCVPHLHLPLQSGSSVILRRMNRQYTRDAFIDMIDRVKGALDRPAITTDIIVGFPGETDEDFEASMEVARQARFSKIHAFPFSPREGTAAYRWRRQFVDPSVVRERMSRLGGVERECSLSFRQNALGSIERVLVEGAPDRHDNPPRRDNVRRGRTDRYFEVHFEAVGDVRPGDLVLVRIDHVTPARTHGTQIPAGANGYSPPAFAHVNR